MKIAYVLSSDIARHRGSTIKVRDQVNEWRRHGYEVEIYSLTPDNAPALIETVRFVKRSNPIVDKIFPYMELLESVKDFNPDILYFRYSLPNATFRALQKLFSSVIEINTDDKEEYKKLFYERHGVKNFLLWQINNILRGGFLKRAEGLVSVTNELAQRKSFTRYNNNITVVPNSIPMAGKSILKKSSPEGPVKLFFIGSPGLQWHGLDILCRLGEMLKSEIEIHIVGANGVDTDNIFWYGYLEEREYLKIMSGCHICVGTLALYRKNLSEACPLKVREYLKYGFPVILGYKDTSFLDRKPPWVLEIPNTGNIFDDSGVVKSISGFCRTFRDFIVPSKESEPFISSSIIESSRINFMKKVVEKF